MLYITAFKTNERNSANQSDNHTPVIASQIRCYNPRSRECPRYHEQCRDGGECPSDDVKDRPIVVHHGQVVELENDVCGSSYLEIEMRLPS